MSAALRIEYQPIATTKLAKSNPKDHDVPTLKASFVRFGFNECPVLNEKTGRLVVGHGRREALLELHAAGEKPPERIQVDADGNWLWPVVRGVRFKNEAEADAYLVAANSTTIRGGWDLPKLANVLESVRQRGAPLLGTGYSTRDLDRLVSKHRLELREPSEPPEPPKVPVAKLGEFWRLGDHVIACGDSRDESLVKRLMGPARAGMLHGDPPYGMGKDFENDNQRGPKLDKFMGEWWGSARLGLADTAAAYVWGNPLDLWRWWWGGLSHTETLTFKNEIVWNKQSGMGQKSSGHLQYPTVTERCLFFALGDQAMGTRNQNRYWGGWDPLRVYLREEARSAGIKAADVDQLTGTRNMWQHWFTRSQWSMISEEGYLALQQATGKFPKSWKQLKHEYDQLREQWEREVEGMRGFHDNTHDKLADVWNFKRVSGAERHGHSTPKPVLLCARALSTSCRRGEVVLVPFGGTGPDILAAEQLERVARVVELDPRYVDVMIERWQDFTGGIAKRISA